MSDELFSMSTNDFKTKFARFLQKKVFLSYLLCKFPYFDFCLIAPCAAASLAMGTLKGEQLT